MEPESSSPYPQVPATRPYPEPTPSSPHDPLQLPEDPSEYYPPTYVLVSPMTSFPQASSGRLRSKNVGWACRTRGGQERCIQGFCAKT